MSNDLSFSCETLSDSLEVLSVVESIEDEDQMVDDFDDNEDTMTESKESQKQSNDRNILVLGERSAEKSIFINSFTTYLTYERLNEAMNGQNLSLIPVSFTIIDPESYEEIAINLGIDGNENACTDSMTSESYKNIVFPYNGYNIRLIDTPGVGDPRDLNEDRVKFYNILDFIAQYEELHCICILLKANNERKNVEFLINQILSHLQRSAGTNIVFVFPNIGSNFFIRETVPILKGILETVNTRCPYVKIAFAKRTIYCIDYESFKFLIAIKNGIEFSFDSMKNLTNNWKTCVNECQRLIKHIVGTDDGMPGLRAQRVTENIAVNVCRRLIVVLSNEMPKITESIEQRFKDIESVRNDIEIESKSLNVLKTRLYISQQDLDVTHLDHSNMVCAADKHFTIINVEGVRKYHYKTVCHEWCDCWYDMVKDIVGDQSLKKCKNFKNYYDCIVCGKGYQHHLCIDYETEVVVKQILDIKVEKQIQNKKTFIEEKSQMIVDNKVLCNELNHELDVIAKTSSKFAHFLKSNAISTHNVSYKTYLEELIRNVELKEGSNNLQTYKQMLDNYEQERDILDKAMNDANTDQDEVSAQEVFNGIRMLYELKNCGKDIEDSMNVT